MRLVPMSRAMLLAGILPLAAASQPVAAFDGEKLRLMTNPAVMHAMDACQPDRSRLCGGVAMGGGRIILCLTANPEKLSPVCSTALISALGAVVQSKSAGAD